MEISGIEIMRFRDELTTLNKTIKTFEDLIGEHISVIHEKNRKGDIKYSKADISKIKGLGFDPKNDIKLGLKKYLKI